jgi:hypothetical protein
VLDRIAKGLMLTEPERCRVEPNATIAQIRAELVGCLAGHDRILLNVIPR